MYIYKNEHNRQQADDWLWDTIPNYGSGVEYASSTSVPLVPSPEQWLQSCHSRAKLDQQERVLLQAW